jgi:uncharacterized membrane protein
MLEKIGITAFTNLVPTTEQIGGIAVGLSLGLSPLTVFIVSLTVNCLLFFPVYLALKILYENFLSRINLFRKYLKHVRKRGKPYIDKYGVYGLTLFIAIPASLTGTYTATVLSWLLGLDWKRSFLAILVGSSIGAFILLAGYLGMFYFLSFIGG